MAKKQTEAFPKDFLWGASTSSHQVEGGNHNQWTVWELENAADLAAKAESLYGRLPIWSEIKAEAQDPSNYISGAGVDHYRRYEEDFDLVRQLNLNSFRFGVEWSRIEPYEGQWDEAAIAHYKNYISELKQRGIQPVINLWHWTLPVWFTKKGGFARRANVDYFLKYVERIAEELILPCKWVITINEPNSYVGMSYLEGHWPPQKYNPLDGFRVYYNLVIAHRRTYDLLKKLDPTLVVGVATQCNNNQPKRPSNLLDKAIAGAANYVWNWWYLNRIRNHQDFVGFNYYFTDFFKGIIRQNPQRRNRLHKIIYRGPFKQRRHNPPGPLNDLGWYMEPSGIYKVIMKLAKKYQKPIVITENGVADRHDKYRQWWLEETISAIAKANAHDANVIGYFHWSLLDNFEWAQGWWPKFGLVAVDRANEMKRTVRPSAKWLAQQIVKRQADN